MSEQTKSRRRIPINFTALIELIVALTTEPQSKYDIVKVTGLDYSTVCRWMQVLARRKLVYIVFWSRRSLRGKFTPHWGWGYNKENAPIPPVLSKTELQRVFRAKLKLKKEANHAVGR